MPLGEASVLLKGKFEPHHIAGNSRLVYRN